MATGVQSTEAFTMFTKDDVNRILFTETFKDTFGDLGPKESFHELLRLRKREVELHLHGVSLSEYYRERKIPRGFRINNAPTLGRSNPEFCDKWCAILDKCSLELMLHVIEETGRDLRSVRSEILQFETSHIHTISADRDNDWLKRLQDQVSQYKFEILAFKRSKFMRVTQDYKDNTVYRWRHGGRQGTYRRRLPMRRARKPPGYVSSSGDSEEDADASTQAAADAFLSMETPANTALEKGIAVEDANTARGKGRGRPPRYGGRGTRNRQ
ncbi:uncharacterized protein LOC121394224 [Xenopus laevis]|uniref:Uncharacterized protein LOC121394224 n=1 Tax=Xenopus laevis TaxID=8355 RepID=A0A8J1KT72_XENLA|nr:uncharacterized protein LOC121394224 [Xenopus laevis]